MEPATIVCALVDKFTILEGVRVPPVNKFTMEFRTYSIPAMNV